MIRQSYAFETCEGCPIVVEHDEGDVVIRIDGIVEVVLSPDDDGHIMIKRPRSGRLVDVGGPEDK